MIIYNTQEVIERSFYKPILDTLISWGLTVDPLKYGNDNININVYNTDLNKIKDEKGYFVVVYGAGNNQSKSEKTVPRIVINPRGFIPGDVGLQRNMVEKEAGAYIVNNYQNETTDQFIEVHAVANKQEHLRMLVQVIFQSLPQRGYLKPYDHEMAPFDGNIFIEQVNFYDTPDLHLGLLEKIYQWEVKDTLLAPPVKVEDGVPIKQIDVDINNKDKNINDHIQVKS